MKNLEIIDVVEMRESELEGTSAGWYGKAADIAFIILYVTVIAFPKLVFA